RVRGVEHRQDRVERLHLARAAAEAVPDGDRLRLAGGWRGLLLGGAGGAARGPHCGEGSGGGGGAGEAVRRGRPPFGAAGAVWDGGWAAGADGQGAARRNTALRAADNARCRAPSSTGLPSAEHGSSRGRPIPMVRSSACSRDRSGSSPASRTSPASTISPGSSTAVLAASPAAS